MPKGLFLYIQDADKWKNLGVFKKMYGQIDALQESSIDIDYVMNTRRGLMLNNETLLAKAPPDFLKKMDAVVHSFTGYYNTLLKQIDFSTYGFIYLRHNYFNYFLVSFLKKLRRNYPQLKIYLEIATFPYIREFNTLLLSPVLLIDRIYSKKVEGLIDRIITYTNDDFISGVPTIKVANGISAEAEMEGLEEEQKVSLAGKQRIYGVAMASNVSYWHAFDRAVLGLKNYYKQKRDKEVHLEIIGGGNEMQNLRRMVQELELQPYVHFTDYVREDLDNLLIHKDFSIGTLGMFRKDVSYDSSLKSREYCYHGLPFVLSTPDLCFEPSQPYWYYTANDESPLDFERILEWLMHLQKEHPDYRVEMQDFARKNLTWKQTFRNFIDHINALPS